MDSLLQIILPYIPSSSIPIVIVVLVCCYLWYKTRTKFMALENDREKSKKSRDNDLQDLRDKCVGNEKEISFLKVAITERNNEIKELKFCVNELNVNMGILSTKIESLSKVIDKITNK